MADTDSLWTPQSLAAAIKGLDPSAGLGVAAIEGSEVLEVTVASAGDFALHVAVGEAQILTSAILWPRDMQEDPDSFEGLMLRTHKALLPLCALSIDTVDGREFYELFGAAPRTASLDELIEEFTLIADSALELARDIGPRSGGHSEDAA